MDTNKKSEPNEPSQKPVGEGVQMPHPKSVGAVPPADPKTGNVFGSILWRLNGGR